MSAIVYIVRVDWCCCMVYMYIPASCTRWASCTCSALPRGWTTSIMYIIRVDWYCCMVYMYIPAGRTRWASCTCSALPRGWTTNWWYYVHYQGWLILLHVCSSQLYQMSKLYLFSPSSGMDNKLVVLCTLSGSADVVVWCTCSSRLYQMSKLYLFSPSSGLYSCPLAMADGAAQIIEVTKWSIKKKCVQFYWGSCLRKFSWELFLGIILLNVHRGKVAY